MRKISVALTLALLTGMALGQQALDAAHENESSIQEVATVTPTVNPLERVVVPTYADLNCAGFITSQAVPDSTFVAGGLNSPHETKFVSGEVVYLSGSRYKDGDRVTFVRALRDPNRYEYFAGQRRLIAATGQPYAELAQGHVVDTRHQMAIALLDFACEPVVPGDLAVPLMQHQKITYHPPVRFDVFAPANGKTEGRIVMAKDFDGELTTGSKVYLTVGSSQGVKVGDYFRVVRSYAHDLKDPVDSLSFKAAVLEDTQKNPPSLETEWYDFDFHHKGAKIDVKDMPRRSLAELIVLSTTPTSATGMITFALEDVHVGDRVELETPVASAQATGSKPAVQAVAVK
jgi:predicted RecA/RadA family phage recombinase